MGVFVGRQPAYSVQDAELVREITTNHFDSFENHYGLIDPDSDALIGQTLVFMKDKKWRDMRTSLTPVFTGSKMRHMFELVVECAEDMVKHLVDESKRDRPVRWEMKEFFCRYSTDVIASCAFGLKTDSLKDPTNQLYTTGMKIFNFRSMAFISRLFLVRTFPKLMQAIEFEVIPRRIKRFFNSLVLGTIAEREKNQIVRPDLISILTQIRSGKPQQHHGTIDDNAGFAAIKESNTGKMQVSRNWTDTEIIGQCFNFFAAGFDTASTVMSLMAYELAVNQDVQQKLYDEIRDVSANLNGARLSYGTLSTLKYLDQVISEALRKWPPLLVTTRQCTNDIELETNGNKFKIERGRVIYICICSIHRDLKVCVCVMFDYTVKFIIFAYGIFFCSIGIHPTNSIQTDLAMKINIKSYRAPTSHLEVDHEVAWVSLLHSIFCICTLVNNQIISFLLQLHGSV